MNYLCYNNVSVKQFLFESFKISDQSLIIMIGKSRRNRIIMPDIYYERLDKMFKDLKIELEDTDDKKKIKEADNFIATFTPQKTPIKIE